MDKKIKVVEFVKTHKKKLLIGAAAIAGGVALSMIGKKNRIPAYFSGVVSTPNAKDIPVADWGAGTLTSCWREGGWINAIVTDLTVADAGKLGEELLKVDGVTTDTALQTVLCFPDVGVN